MSRVRRNRNALRFQCRAAPRHVHALKDTFSIFAVFDGHGQKGHDISQFAKAAGSSLKERRCFLDAPLQDFLPKIILKDPRSREAR